MLSIALPKGRLGEKVYNLLRAAGYFADGLFEDGRKLIFENTEIGVRFFLVKPSDVGVYVERGAADVGIVGKDILLEEKPEVYELLDLQIGVCRMTVAAKKEFIEDYDRPLRVATSFANIAKDYFASVNREVEIIGLNGSVEIAPLLNMADVIVDIVETGTTLKENGLEVKTVIMPISARLICNKTSLKFKHEAVSDLAASLNNIVHS
ncbi:MAG: ATP phosphoribosyltransferase [Clostridiaceae bacterium]|jgi:ATP phosphoribosyltransferase|nr:ATP phosphoribosyltransferase [Clostridiaceae bacterium]